MTHINDIIKNTISETVQALDKAYCAPGSKKKIMKDGAIVSGDVMNAPPDGPSSGRTPDQKKNRRRENMPAFAKDYGNAYMSDADDASGGDHMTMAGLVDALGESLANAVCLSFRAQGFHWNVSGPGFPQFHALFSDVYATADALVDPLAENLRKLGFAAPNSIDELIALRTTPAAMGPASQDPIAQSRDLLAHTLALTESLQEGFDVANTLDEQGICNFLADAIDQQQKWAWQLRMIIGEK